MRKTCRIYAIIQLGILFLSAVVLSVASGVAWAQEPLKVGEKYAIHIDSGGLSDVEKISTEKGQRYEISHPGATYIAVHFKQFNLAPGEVLIVSDADGGQSYVLRDKGKMNAGKFWSQHVKGDTIRLEFVSTGQQTDKGFVIDEYAAGLTNLGSAIERICGVNDLENAVCRKPSPEYDKAQAVARLLIRGAWLCTGWLASANNHLITNEHCITSATEALNTDYEFGAEEPFCGDTSCQLCAPGTIYSGSVFIQDDPGLDYSLVQLAGNPAATYGFLEIDNRTAVIGEQIYLVSHPAGRAKEFAYNSSEDIGEVGRVLSLTEPTCTGGTLEIGYWNDTEGGSSGSPVLAVSTQKVIALHHCHNFCDNGGDPNRGVPINLICNEICDLLGNGNPCNPNGTCESGEDCNNCPEDCISGLGGGTKCNTCFKGVCDGKCNPSQDGPDCADCASSYCCGDGTCEGDEYSTNCELDCYCGNGTCDPDEDNSNCADDCPAQSCGGNKAPCDSATDCCSNKCKAGTCRGN